MAADGKRAGGVQAAAICAALVMLLTLLGEDAGGPRAGVQCPQETTVANHEHHSYMPCALTCSCGYPRLQSAPSLATCP
jgi:hypothetical protein